MITSGFFENQTTFCKIQRLINVVLLLKLQLNDGL